MAALRESKARKLAATIQSQQADEIRTLYGH
jgi:hypothetical protein